MSTKTTTTVLTLLFSLYITTYEKTIDDDTSAQQTLSQIQPIQDSSTTLAEGKDSSQLTTEDSDAFGPIGPPYPITGAWFMDRFRAEEWNETLKMFKAQGGDTVLLRAPPVLLRTKEDLIRDPDFQWCGSHNNSHLGNGGPQCFDEAVSDLRDMGHNVTAFLSYEYEEGFTDAIMLCPNYDRRINSSRVYYRIVLPSKLETKPSTNPCSFPPGSDLVVLFTSFAGTDPHQLLLQTASMLNLSVFFGLPETYNDFPTDLMPAYFAWVKRVLSEHKDRFSQMPSLRVVSGRKDPGRKNTGMAKEVTMENDPTVFIPEKEKPESKTRGRNKVWMDKQKTLYDSLAGYFSDNNCNLGNPQSVSTSNKVYKQLGTLVKSYKKSFGVSPSINLNKILENSTMAQHIQGFTSLLQTGVIDIVAVQEGRGEGKGGYYWDYQKDKPVKESDSTLDTVLHYLHPNLRVNVTFAEVFTNSNQEIFTAFQHARDQLLPSVEFDLWLNVQAFEYLRDDPCLPVDRKGSGMGQLLNRASKERVDRALSIAGAKVQKVVSFAWDSDFTCKTEHFNNSIHAEIMSDLSRPIIANCSFHTPHNLSVVLLGFNLEGETQGYKVEWMDTRGRQRVSPINGYYFELDYGEAHNLVKSLEYVMLWDISEMVLSLAPTGTVNVSASNAFEPCSFAYDLPYFDKSY